MEATKRLKAQGLRKGGKAKKARPETKSNKTMTPQEKKELMDKIKKRQGKMTNPFVTLDSLGRPTMEAKKGGAAKKFPDLSGDGKVTMKDILMGRGVVKKPKKKAMGGSMTLEGGKLKGVKDAPEERRKEKIQKIKGFLKRRSLLNPMGGARGLGKVAGRAAKRGYGIAKK